MLLQCSSDLPEKKHTHTKADIKEILKKVLFKTLSGYSTVIHKPIHLIYKTQILMSTNLDT